jgi:ubiquinone/menaquinone biosynthesis C-methylase UbiE
MPSSPANDSVKRFDSRVENYAKYRPHYPPEIIELLKLECGLNPKSVVADVGSGTGIFSELFLKNGNQLLGVEPNATMRSAAENLLKSYPHFVSIDGTAESTGLPDNSVDFIVAAQAFHWFDREKSRLEFTRILKPAGWVVLVWNERRLDSTPFLRECEEMFLSYGTDYGKIRHENVRKEIGGFFFPQPVRNKSIDNFQEFDFEGFEGRVRSASYTPEPGNPNFEPMMARLREIFDIHSRDGRVTYEYDTTVYYGQLSDES